MTTKSESDYMATANNIPWVMAGNAAINTGWLMAFCYMVYLDCNWWAAACILGAICSGYRLETRNLGSSEV